MKGEQRELFKAALLEAMEEKRQEELAECPEEIIPSARHLKRVSRILGIDVRRKDQVKRYRPRRVIAWALAAVLLMVSALTAYANRGTESGFAERVYGQYTQVNFTGADDILPTDDIEQVYELGYVPRGYVQVRLYEHEKRTECIYTNAQGDEIEFQQHPLNGKGEWGFHNGLGTTQIKKYGEIYVYCYDCPDSRTFLWRDQKYAMLLFVSTPMETEEILRMMDSVQIRTNEWEEEWE